VLRYLSLNYLILIVLYYYSLFSHHCNRYDESAVSNRESEARDALQRFLFYSNRHMNHKKSLDLERKLYAAVNEKMEETLRHTLSWIDVCLIN